jgi:hypothetical protein
MTQETSGQNQLCNLFLEHPEVAALWGTTFQEEFLPCNSQMLEHSVHLQLVSGLH